MVTSLERKGILALKEEYETKKKSLEKIIGFKEHTVPVIFYEGHLMQVEEILEDLEELLK